MSAIVSLQDLAVRMAKIIVENSGEDGIKHADYLAKMKAIMIGESVANNALRIQQYKIRDDGRICIPAVIRV